MAQYSYKPPRDFDTHWVPRLAFAAQFLQERQAAWLLGDSEFPIRLTTSLIFHVFAFDFVSARLSTFQGVTAQQLASRTHDDWKSVLGSPVEECALLLSTRKPGEHIFATNGISKILSSSVQDWNKTATMPSSADVLRECAEFLSKHRFIRLYA